ncbi:MAG: class I SAM-dependent methyltransferase [Polyangiales bacterium]|nr:class I SAM-dependent methyltransferase [Myxococcales bacterium]
MPRSRRRAKRILTRANTERHALYERAVQSADIDADLIENIFRREMGRRPRTLREDFCGTAWLCAEWVKRGADRKAVGIDLDAGVLAWGKAKHIDPLGEDAKRVKLVRANVLKPPAGTFDAICAYNYSYFCFRDRDTLRSYFETAKRSLVPGGLLFLDAFGGSNAQEVQTETRRCRGYTYKWEQVRFNPIDHDFLAHIHFEFDDGSAWKRAFTYSWRLWQLPEIQELLREAGFRSVDVYWEDEDKRGKGLGTFRKRKIAPADATWNAYIVAKR